MVRLTRYNRRRVALTAATLICVGILACTLGEADKTKLPELEKLAAEVHVFPGFSEVQEPRHVGNEGMSILTYFYRSPAKYEEVKNFYTNALLPKGWSGPFEENVPKWFINDGSKEVRFKRSEYSVVIENDAADGAAVPYSVSFTRRSIHD